MMFMLGKLSKSQRMMKINRFNRLNRELRKDKTSNDYLLMIFYKKL